MPLYLFQAKIAAGLTPIFGAEFCSVDEANAFVRRIKSELAKECVGASTNFLRINNTRSRRLSRNMRTFSKPRRMKACSIRKMPGVPKQWKIEKVPKRERRHRQYA